MGAGGNSQECSGHGGAARPPLLSNRDGGPVDLGGCYQGCPAFLIGGGPSLRDLDLSRLDLPGCLTMAMNNAPKTVRPDLWVSVDDPSCFLRSIWLDPKIMKFAPMSHAAKQIFDSDAWRSLDRTPADCPNTFFYRRNNQFDAASYLAGDSVNWGSHRRHGGGRSVMLAAVRLLHHLGVRKVFLVGVDFKMDAGYTYHFEQGRHRAVFDCNRKTYGLLNERFRELLPIFEAEGFEVFNCNPDSGLTAFPAISFDEAVRICREGLPEDASAERTEGLYDKRKDRGGKPRVRRRLAEREAAPALQPPRVTDGVEARPHTRSRAHRYPVGRGVVVGSDIGSEWMLGWWYGNYREHNDYPVTFVDYGMSLEASRWCAGRGTVKRLPGKFPTMPKAWFYKPAMFLLCEAEKIIGIDLDCEIRGPLGPVFDLIGDHPVVARDPIIFRSYRHLFRKGHYYNTGVIGAPADNPLILAWGRAVLARHPEFRSDQELFNLALYERPGAQITELPEKFNRLRVNGDCEDAVVMHWTGAEGKREIRRKIEDLGRIGSLPRGGHYDGVGIGAEPGTGTTARRVRGGRGERPVSARPFVTMTTLGADGRLGNQLFRVAALIGIARRNGVDVRLPAWPLTEFLELPGEMFGHEIGAGLPVWDLNRHRRGRFAFEEVDVKESTDFRGLFQSERWWAGANDEIRACFRLKRRYENEIRRHWGAVLEERPVSIHVRRTDYLEPGNRFFTDPVEAGFYDRALELVSQDVPILVFSDDLNWCREHLFEDAPDTRRRLVFVDPGWRGVDPGLADPVLRTRKGAVTTGHDVLEMFLMSYCAEHIVPNSTFSWWGAWLNPAPGKRVVFHADGFSEEWLRREGDISSRTPQGWVTPDRAKQGSEIDHAAQTPTESGRRRPGVPHFKRSITPGEIAGLLGGGRQLILEIGAHDGSDTEALLEAMPGANIHCFEPEPTAITQFRERREWPGRCVLHECAVGSEDGDVTFYRSSGVHHGRDRWNLSGSILEPTGHLHRHQWCKFDPPTTVRCVRLDDWYGSGPGQQPGQLVDLIWADVQGAEARLIQGGAAVLSKTRYLYTEFSDTEMYAGQPTLVEIMSLLPGFELVATYANNALLANRHPGQETGGGEEK